MKITSNKKGWQKLKSSLLRNQELHVKFGWFPEQTYGEDNDNLQMAQVASWNEFGHPNGGAFAGTSTPERPFMRVWLPEEMKGKGAYTASHLIGVMAFAQKPLRTGLNKVGPVLVIAVQEAMRKLDTPVNSEATIALKGFDDPLRETGQLINSVTFKVGRKAEDK